MCHTKLNNEKSWATKKCRTNLIISPNKLCAKGVQAAQGSATIGLMGRIQLSIESWDAVEDQDILGLMSQGRSRTELGNAIDCIEKDLSGEKRLHRDLYKHFQIITAFVVLLLGKVVVFVYALILTGLFNWQVTLTFRAESCINFPSTN